MESVNIKRDALKLVVESNRERHQKQWAAAFDGYRTACIAALKANLAAFEAGKAERVCINEDPPEDHTQDYDRALRMLQMSVDEVIPLSEQHFQQYVMDQWNWSPGWARINAKYLGRQSS